MSSSPIFFSVFSSNLFLSLSLPLSLASLCIFIRYLYSFFSSSPMGDANFCVQMENGCLVFLLNFPFVLVSLFLLLLFSPHFFLLTFSLFSLVCHLFFSRPYLEHFSIFRPARFAHVSSNYISFLFPFFPLTSVSRLFFLLSFLLHPRGVQTFALKHTQCTTDTLSDLTLTFYV